MLVGRFYLYYLWLFKTATDYLLSAPPNLIVYITIQTVSAQLLWGLNGVVLEVCADFPFYIFIVLKRIIVAVP